MKKIYFEDILDKNISALYSKKNSESTIYYEKDKPLAYKIFNKMNLNSLLNKRDKVEYLSTLKLDNVILPNDKIVYHTTNIFYPSFKGYSMDYINNSCQMNDYKEKNDNCSDSLVIMREISKTLRKIHEQGISVVDLDFSNIIIDDNSKHYFVDFDSCKVDNYFGEMVSSLIKDYYQTKFRQIKNKHLNNDFDKLSLILSTYNYLFNKPFSLINEKDYDSLQEQIKFLKDSKDIFNSLKKSPFIAKVPYLDEIINTETNYKLEKKLY